MADIYSKWKSGFDGVMNQGRQIASGGCNKLTSIYNAAKQSVCSRTYATTEDVYGGPIGYTGQDVGEEYIVFIEDDRPKLYEGGQAIHKRGTARQVVQIRAILQDDLEMETESSWAPFSAATVVSGLSAEIASLVNRSLVNRWMTRRVWRGTTPMNFILNLKFCAEFDTEREVKLPCKELHRMNLPYRGEKKLGNWFLSPPGPAPLQFWANNEKGRGEIITIDIGGLVRIKNCVVKSSKVKYMNRWEAGGGPLEAVVSVHFQTFEIITKEALDTEVYDPSNIDTSNGGL